MTEHTPTPWKAIEQKSKDGRSLGWIINFGNGRIGWSSYATAVPNEGETEPYTQSGANAAFIVDACNNHDRLVGEAVRLHVFIGRALEHCRNAGKGNEIVAERVIERVEQELASALTAPALLPHDGKVTL